ncbi:MAG: hypothetical protein JSR93_10600 [Verrucomicrobia bacterium]|nr:hypothetical protein [Verrucomicrobiota bacterium]
MTTITPNLFDQEPAQLEELDTEQCPSTAFKDVIEEISSSTDSRQGPSIEKDPDDEALSGCIISIFELPRSHFTLPEEEELIEGPKIDNIPACLAMPHTGVAAAPMTFSSNPPVAASQPVKMPAEIEALFEKMAGTMLVLSSSNESETTVFLDAPQFDRSPFYGTRITIKEFSTAPKAFNIEIASSALALNAIDVHKPALLSAFAKGDFNFSIGRLDTEILQEDRPLFHRKEAVSQDQEDLQQ